MLWIMLVTSSEVKPTKPKQVIWSVRKEVMAHRVKKIIGTYANTYNPALPFSPFSIREIM
jgi:hypothetical protein